MGHETAIPHSLRFVYIDCCIINPRRVCAARVTVCASVCVRVCTCLLPHFSAIACNNASNRIVYIQAASEGHEKIFTFRSYGDICLRGHFFVSMCIPANGHAVCISLSSCYEFQVNSGGFVTFTLLGPVSVSMSEILMPVPWFELGQAWKGPR